MKRVMSTNKVNIITFIIAIAIPLSVGFLSSYLTKDTMEQYQQLVQPEFAPPGWIFPIVWTILFVLMGVSSYIVYNEGIENSNVRNALLFYGIQLIVNFFWTIIFFGFELRGFAFIWLILLLVLIIITTVKFYRINKIAAYLMIPYIIWVSFAGVLNYVIWQLNK